jgi:hypothetical protein
MIYFASYDLKLYNRYRDRIRTIILCIEGYPASNAGFDGGSLGYNTTVVNMSDKDEYDKLQNRLGQKFQLVLFFPV